MIGIEGGMHIQVVTFKLSSTTEACEQIYRNQSYITVYSLDVTSLHLSDLESTCKGIAPKHQIKRASKPQIAKAVKHRPDSQHASIHIPKYILFHPNLSKQAIHLKHQPSSAFSFSFSFPLAFGGPSTSTHPSSPPPVPEIPGISPSQLTFKLTGNGNKLVPSSSK